MHFPRLPACLGLVLLACCAHGEGAVPASDATVATLLADGRLWLIRTGAESAPRAYAVASGPLDQAANHLLAQSLDGRFLVALAPPADSGSSILFALDVRSGASRSATLHDGTAYTTLALGPRTGAAYLTGVGPDGVVIAGYEVPSLRREHRWIAVPTGVRTPALAAYSSGIDADERRLYVNYHDKGTEWFDLTASGPRTCDAGGAFGRCMRAHDYVLPVANRVLYATGSCGYAGGFAALTLPGGASPPATARIRSPAWLRDRTVCGERLAVAPDGRWVAIARRRPPPSASRGPGEITLVEARTGRVMRRITVPAPPLDVLVLR
jgi:hypothetical protein